MNQLARAVSWLALAFPAGSDLLWVSVDGARALPLGDAASRWKLGCGRVLEAWRTSLCPRVSTCLPLALYLGRDANSAGQLQLENFAARKAVLTLL